MKLQTELLLKQQENQIDYKSNVVLLGSCFVENIGERLASFKFQNTINPFGILFHPKAIERLVSKAINKENYSKKDVFFSNEQWHCFDAHSKNSQLTQEDLIIHLNEKLEETKRQLESASHIIITLGTAWVYTHLESEKIVANCYKVSQKAFQKSLLSIQEIKASLKIIIETIASVNQKAKIIFTVSPVRHIKDGFVENTQSKAHLISAIHNVIEAFKEQAVYFPSFEIMMDELRDYRFYKHDMLHPNTTAVNYIWEKFQLVWIASEAKKTMEDVDAINKGLKHKPFNSKGEAHQKFIQHLKMKQDKLQAEFPFMLF